MKSQIAVFLFLFAPLAISAHTPPEPPKLSDGSEKREHESEENEGTRKKARVAGRFEIDNRVPERFRDQVLAFAIAAADGDLQTIENVLRNSGNEFLEHALEPRVIDTSEERYYGAYFRTRLSPLAIAAGGGHLHVVRALLQFALRNPSVLDPKALNRAAKLGQTQAIRILLEFALQNPDLRKNFFGDPESWGTFAHVAYDDAFEELRTVLDFLEQHPVLVSSLLPEAGITPFWYLDNGPNEKCMRLLLDFVVRHPHLAPRFFGYLVDYEDQPIFGTFARFRAVYAIRLFLEYAERNEALAELIFATKTDGITALIDLFNTDNDDHENDETHEIMRLLLESPFRERILGDFTELENGNNIGIAREIELWTIILEYVPSAAGTHPRFGQVGVLEAAVMARDINRVRTLLEEGRDFNPRLLTAMLTHYENFDRPAFARFLSELNQLRETLMQPSMLNRGRELFRRVLANPGARNFEVDEQPIPPHVQTLDTIVQILRPRIVVNLQTMTLEALGRAATNMGYYGRQGQFANEEQAVTTIAHMHNINLPLAVDRYLPGARRHTTNLRAFLLSLFIGSFAGRLP